MPTEGMGIFDLETDYKTASAENKTLLLRLINSKQETINRLLDEKKAPSRGTVIGSSGKRSSRGVVKCTQYLESYWVLIRGTKTKDREFTDQGRVPVKLLKSHEEKDWALFWRDDGKEFPAEDIAQIDRNVNDQNLKSTHQRLLSVERT
eukprot:gene11872-8466_t